MFPTNEAETIALYKLIQERVGWQIVHLQTAFPDAIIENEKGMQLAIEFEWLSGNFKKHKHDPNGCDLIVCWHDDWENPSVPVWALRDCAKKEAEIVGNLLRKYAPKAALIVANGKIQRLKIELASKGSEVERLEVELADKGQEFGTWEESGETLRHTKSNMEWDYWQKYGWGEAENEAENYAVLLAMLKDFEEEYGLEPGTLNKFDPKPTKLKKPTIWENIVNIIHAIKGT